MNAPDRNESNERNAPARQGSKAKKQKTEARNAPAPQNALRPKEAKKPHCIARVTRALKHSSLLTLIIADSLHCFCHIVKGAEALKSHIHCVALVTRALKHSKRRLIALLLSQGR
eukprot:2024579-Amphidinium_carterae.1